MNAPGKAHQKLTYCRSEPNQTTSGLTLMVLFQRCNCVWGEALLVWLHQSYRGPKQRLALYASDMAVHERKLTPSYGSIFLVITMVGGIELMSSVYILNACKKGKGDILTTYVYTWRTLDRQGRQAPGQSETEEQRDRQRDRGREKK